MTPRMLLSLVLLIWIPLSVPSSPAQLDVHLITDEADAALAILAIRKEGKAPLDADWQRLFATEAYGRLKQREASLNRTFTDEQFRDFMLSSDLLAKEPALALTLARWKNADLSGAAARALAYLPAGSRIRARIYPVIKPQPNSFVFEVTTNPAIFLFIDPELTEERFENTVAHELHHIGYAAACAEAQASDDRFPERVKTARQWMGAFGEGLAMLAAAGGPNIHPHAVSPPEDRERWDRDLAGFNDDLKKLERFFLDIIDGRLTDEARIREAGFSFFGVQGPWYTVGWKMAATVEASFGRAKLLECLCDPAKLMSAFNEAAAKENARGGYQLAVWSPDLMKSILGSQQAPDTGPRLTPRYSATHRHS